MDACLLALALAGVAALTLALWRPDGTPRTASVWVDGTAARTIDLRRDATYTVRGRLGETRLEVRDGRIRVTASPGARRICVRDGWLAAPGATTVCLPNRVVVTLAGSAGDDGLDGETW